MKVEIRKAKLDDCVTVDELLTKLILDEKQYDNNIDENFKVSSYYQNYYDKETDCLLVGVIDDKIIGYIYGYIKDDANIINKEAKLDALYVEEDYRHQGIAQSLIDSFLNYCKEKEVKIVEVNACSENIHAINLYKKNNFQTTKITMKQEI